MTSNATALVMNETIPSTELRVESGFTQKLVSARENPSSGCEITVMQKSCNVDGKVDCVW